MSNQIELARYYDENEGKVVCITIADYNNFIKNKDREKIADFIYNRLHSRYIKPFEYKDDKEIYQTQYKNGFSMMANCCLLIETFQAFKENKNDEELFKSFFADNTQFKDFEKTEKMNGNIKNSFYIHVRCGILHQGETRGGWKINRRPDTPLLDNKNINANKFMEELKVVLNKYRDDLIEKDFDTDGLWDKFKTKMDDVINNCQ